MPEGIPEGAQPIAGLGGGEGEFAPPQNVEPEPQVAEPDYASQLSELQEQLAQQSQIIEQLAPVAEYMQGMPGPQQQIDGGLVPPDPFSDTYQQDFENYLEARDAQRLGPFQEVLQERQLDELESRARDMIADVESEKGELLRPKYEEGQEGLNPADLVLQFAQAYSPNMVQQYGPGIRADEAAIELAYEHVKALQEGLIASSQERQQNQLSALSGAVREPGNSGIAAQPVVTTQPGGWEAFSARHGLS